MDFEKQVKQIKTQKDLGLGREQDCFKYTKVQDFDLFMVAKMYFTKIKDIKVTDYLKPLARNGTKTRIDLKWWQLTGKGIA